MKDNLKKNTPRTSCDDFPRKSKIFCMIPWIHMHILPDSRVIPCCFSNSNQELGHLNKRGLRRIWNSKRIRRMRISMLNDLPNEECSRCYELEINGGFSLRKEVNGMFADQYYLTKETSKAGYLKNLTMKYLHIIFSNSCNFRCRTCSSYLSSGWHNDEKRLGESRAFPKLKLNKNSGNLNKYLDKFLDETEVFYFGGGEPLISDEHYEILDKLISLDRKDVKLIYNTNLSILEYKDKSILDYWDKFSDVTVAASLDAFGVRGELIRKGQNWKKTEKNIRTLKTRCPHINFLISPTVSVLNVLHLADFHRYMFKKGFIGINDIHLNILSIPLEYRVQVLPKKLKEDAKNRLSRHIEFLIKK